MTSKEALDILFHLAGFNVEYLDKEEIKEYNEALSHYEEIASGLEVLKIVKEHKLLNYVIKNKKCANMYKLTDDKIEKLKEWIKNE